MDTIFNYDNKFFRFIGKVIDCFYISLLWMLFCIPVFTIGVSSTAMYDTVHRVLRHNRSYVWRTFWSALKSNFKQTTKIWLIMLVILAVLAVDCILMRSALVQGAAIGVLYYVFLVMTLFVIIWAIYTFAYSARFEQGMKATMKNGVILAVGNLPWSFLMLVVMVVAMVALMFFPVLVFFLPAIVCMIYEVILERIFRKIMSPEDLQREKENDWMDKE